MGRGRGISSREKLQLINTEWKAKLGVGAPPYNFSNRGVRQEYQVQEQLWFHTLFEASLGFVRPISKNKK